MTDINLLQKGDLKTSDFTNDDSNNNQGIGIRVSADNGNLLQQRKTGLYYGVEAPPDTANLYVSSSMGNDSNAGTRASPLKTIREAFNRNSVGTTFTIHLFESDTHPVHSSWGPFGTGKVATFKPYGDVFTALALRNPKGTSHIFRSRELVRPVMQFIADGTITLGSTTSERGGFTATNSPISTPYTFFGITVDTTAAADHPILANSDAFLGTALHAISATFIGCNLRLGNAFYLLTEGV